MPETATAPGDIALLVAVPVDEDGFGAAWRRRSDYLRDYADLETGWSAYGKAARLTRDVCAECAALGATVVLDARLEDVKTCVPRFPVVALIAHMRFPLVTVDDVLSVEELRRRLEQGAEPEWRMIAAECHRSVDVALQRRLDPADIVAAMNRLLRATERGLGETVEDMREGRRLADHHSGGLLRLDRPRLDELCGPAILREGEGIELADGMASARRFIEATPAAYGGLLDLRMCKSISLGAAVRRARPGARAAIGKKQTYPHAAVVLFKSALLYMTRRRVSYEDAMLAFSEALP